MLPSCDVDVDSRGLPVTSRHCLNNEFFTRALTAFPERITDGEFTQAMKARMNIETSRRRIDPWKAKFFEEYWGQLSEKKVPTEERRADQKAKLQKLDSAILKLSPQSQIASSAARASPNRHQQKQNGNATAKSEALTVKVEVKEEQSVEEEEEIKINHCEETMIQSWEAIQAVKTLSSPDMKVMMQTHSTVKVTF